MGIVLNFYKDITYITVMQLIYKLFNLFISFESYDLLDFYYKINNSTTDLYRLVEVIDNIA
jgi:hypothetical protein